MNRSHVSNINTVGVFETYSHTKWNYSFEAKDAKINRWLSWWWKTCSLSLTWWDVEQDEEDLIKEWIAPGIIEEKQANGNETRPILQSANCLPWNAIRESSWTINLNW